MKKLIYPIYCCLLFSFACSEDKDPVMVCGVINPVEDLAWLNAIKQAAESGSSSEYSYLAQATFEGETVFYSGTCHPLANWALLLLDCGGNQIEGEYTFADLGDSKIVWQPEDSRCQFD
ncbi:hypothetical protein [Algoriphagus winogradskyi]|uniref:Uncharacterized protein n=1 Tax=Algoriphagus winogradskyi TaxID=237017 RepID=A0ABY1NEQ2_9BACT|nr:hypothetical protein [Algoriphagus winogradskyi]SMP07561.1 hypothetical protein SAMN06265367_101619 [Algoriphagus winogradskyi]